MHGMDDQAVRMIEVGASAYCTKDGDTADLLAAIRGGGKLCKRVSSAEINSETGRVTS
jgi:DNA-binding NarL/FixJ family response regulator